MSQEDKDDLTYLALWTGSVVAMVAAVFLLSNYVLG